MSVQAPSSRYMLFEGELESLYSTGEAGSSVSYVYMTYPQTC